jgi:hypothetical protein
VLSQALAGDYLKIHKKWHISATAGQIRGTKEIHTKKVNEDDL